MLGKIEGRRRGWQRMRWLDGITDSMDMSLISSRTWWWTGKPGVLQSMGSQRVGYDWVTEMNWLTYSHLVASVFGNFIAWPFDDLLNNRYKFPAVWETTEKLIGLLCLFFSSSICELTFIQHFVATGKKDNAIRLRPVRFCIPVFILDSAEVWDWSH